VGPGEPDVVAPIRSGNRRRAMVGSSDEGDSLDRGEVGGATEPDAHAMLGVGAVGEVPGTVVEPGEPWGLPRPKRS